MNKLELVKEQVLINDVVEEYIPTEKACSGDYKAGRCPFHGEETSCFVVSPNKETFYCFGCHVGGDVISFVSKIENCSPDEAADILIKRYKIELPKE